MRVRARWGVKGGRIGQGAGQAESETRENERGRGAGRGASGPTTTRSRSPPASGSQCSSSSGFGLALPTFHVQMSKRSARFSSSTCLSCSPAAAICAGRERKRERGANRGREREKAREIKKGKAVAHHVFGCGRGGGNKI
eukprot:scaffold163931_cov32-Tisochrysis_lutea.AAC.1